MGDHVAEVNQDPSSLPVALDANGPEPVSGESFDQPVGDGPHVHVGPPVADNEEVGDEGDRAKVEDYWVERLLVDQGGAGESGKRYRVGSADGNSRGVDRSEANPSRTRRPRLRPS